MSTELYTYFLEETLNHLKEINKLPEDINEFNITVIKDSKTHNILGMSYEDFIDNIESLDTKYIRGHSWDSDPEGWISFNDGSWTEREYGEHISQGSYWEYKTCPTNKKKVI